MEQNVYAGDHIKMGHGPGSESKKILLESVAKAV